MNKFARMIVRWTLKRYLREAQAHAENGLAVSHQLLKATVDQPGLYDMALRANKPLTWLCRTLEQALGQTRMSSGPDEKLQLALPFAAAQ